MAQTENTELIQMLQAAARDEHGAVLQYLRHAYMIGEGELACEIEGIAREEMRHFWMISRWIVSLGGDPTIARGMTDVQGSTHTEWMQRDVAAEDRAIAMYQDYLTRIQDPDLRSDIEYILGDEMRHHGDFVHYVDKVTQAQAAMPTVVDAEGVTEAADAGLPAHDESALTWGVQHEYAALLQYLMHSFLLKDRDEEISSQLMTQAINEMQHLGWFGEELTDNGVELPLAHHAVTVPADPQAMLEADIQLERGTADHYAEVLPQMSHPGAKGVVDDARDQEEYHHALFSRLLKRLMPEMDQQDGKSSKIWTIGSLKRKE